MTPFRSRSERRRSNRLGRRAEWTAAVWLLLRGYRLIARGFKVSGGEIDIIARRGAVVAFVEVKARATYEDALLAVTPMKQKRICRASAVWLSRNGWATAHTLRGDVVVATPRRWPRHIEDAFPLRIG